MLEKRVVIDRDRYDKDSSLWRHYFTSHHHPAVVPGLCFYFRQCCSRMAKNRIQWWLVIIYTLLEKFSAHCQIYWVQVSGTFYIKWAAIYPQALCWRFESSDIWCFWIVFVIVCHWTLCLLIWLILLTCLFLLLRSLLKKTSQSQCDTWLNKD